MNPFNVIYPAFCIRPLSGSALTLLLALPTAGGAAEIQKAYGPTPELPRPNTSHSVQHYNTQKGWPADKMPSAPEGFTVTSFARDLETPRWLYVLDNGDVLVAQARTLPKESEDTAADPEQKERIDGHKRSGTVTGDSPNRVTLLRDTNNDGHADERHVLLAGLNQPFGMAYVAPYLYVANTDGIVRFSYKPGQTDIKDRGEKILSLPAGGYNNHWTRNIVVSADKKQLLVSVGSASNAEEYGMDEEKRRANILAIDLDGKNETIYGAGLRNPNGMAFEPQTGALWTAVNERDDLGDDLVPDYITSVQKGGFYGWPFSYWGQNRDPRVMGGDDLVARAIVPDYAMGNHTASLGLTFYTGKSFPARYQGGAFVGQRGSWNRTTFSGYKVVFVPFNDGKPAGPAEDFLTGFMPNAKTGETYGRPVGVAMDARGGLLVADDTGNAIWRVSPK